MRLSTEHLIPESSTDDANRLLLKVVHVHRRAGPRLSDTIGPHTLPTRSRRHACKGESLTVATKNGAVTVNDARVIKTDIAASNGVIHVVDSVLLPN